MHLAESAEKTGGCLDNSDSVKIPLRRLRNLFIYYGVYHYYIMTNTNCKILHKMSTHAHIGIQAQILKLLYVDLYSSC